MPQPRTLARLDRMTEREKFRTRGGYYLLTRNAEAAIDELTALIRQYPSDTAGLNFNPRSGIILATALARKPLCFMGFRNRVLLFP